MIKGEFKYDYEKLLDIILEEKEYSELVDLPVSRDNLMDIPKYKKEDEKLKENINFLKGMGYQTSLYEQTDNERSFRHISLYRDFNGLNFFRLYMCPEDKNLYPLITELITKCNSFKMPIYFKYSKEPRYDKLLIYINNVTEYKKVIDLLKIIKNEHPEYFENMKKSDVWLYETEVEGTYLASSKFTISSDYKPFPSYTKAFEGMMCDIEKELLFHYRKKNVKELKTIPRNELLKTFDLYFTREIGKRGMMLHVKENNEIGHYKNELFPGMYNSIDEKINLTDNGIEIGKRLDTDTIEYFIIPFGHEIPMKPDDFKKYNSYAITYKEDIYRSLYPNSYKNICKNVNIMK